MKYLFYPIAYILATIYLIAERVIKILVCVLLFFWHLSFNKKYYWFIKEIWVLVPSVILFDIYRFTSLKKYYSFTYDKVS